MFMQPIPVRNSKKIKRYADIDKFASLHISIHEHVIVHIKVV